jgi:hypothetical protein
MKRFLLASGLVLGMTLGVAGPAAAAGNPTCAEMMGIANHGEHVLGLYVVGGSLALGYWPPTGGIGQYIGGTGADLPGGPGPTFHFLNGFQPGASFCVPGAQSPTSPPGQG